MRNSTRHTTSRACRLAIALAASSLLVFAGCATRKTAPGARGAGSEKRFADPKAAVDALVAACHANDEPALLAIFGDEAKTVVSTGDAAADRERCQRFVDAAGEMTRLDPAGPDTLELVVGSDDFPFPIPLVHDAKGWRFDTEQGAQEVIRRRVGADELEAIAVCRTYAKGNRTPQGPVIAPAGDKAKPSTAWWGYHFRALGSDGLLAYPAQYRTTGIMTFVVGKDGRVFEKDLGEKTDTLVASIDAPAADATWKAVD